MDNLYLRAIKELLEFVEEQEKFSREEFFVKTTKYFVSIKRCRKNTVLKKLQNFKTSYKIFQYKIHWLIMKKKLRDVLQERKIATFLQVLNNFKLFSLDLF